MERVGIRNKSIKKYCFMSQKCYKKAWPQQTEVQEMLSGFALGISFPHMLLGVVLVIQAKKGGA